MNIGRLALIALFGGALMAFGCSSSDAGGIGGDGGSDGDGGDGIDPVCEPVAKKCSSLTSEAIADCCLLPTPPMADVCDGTESLDNPASCAASGNPVTHILTRMALDKDCNAGYNLDSCDGDTCVNGTVNADSEGLEGIDNGLAAIAPTLEMLTGRDMSGLQQAFSNSLCGQTDDPTMGTCDGGGNDGNPCTPRCDAGANQNESCVVAADCPDGACFLHAECPNGVCDLEDDDCTKEIPKVNLTFEVDANVANNCASVKVRSIGVCANGGSGGGGGTTTCTSDADCVGLGDGTCSGGGESDVFLNLTGSGGSGGNGDGAVCMSGGLGTIPVLIEGTPATFGNAIVRMTVSEVGFSNGLLGATADSDTAITIAKAISPTAEELAGSIFDINDQLTQDTSATCNAVSMALVVGGVAQ